MSTPTPDPAPVVVPETTPPSSAAVAKIPAADANGQLIVSLAIVVILGCIALGLIVASAATKDWTFAAGAIGAIIGALATALNAPTGITNVLRAGASTTTPPAGG